MHACMASCMSVYKSVGINYNKGTKRVNSVAPGCTIEYGVDEPEREVRKVYERRANPWAKYATDAKLDRGSLRDAEARPGYKIVSKSMEDLDSWETTKPVTSYEGDMAEREKVAQEEIKAKGNRIVPAYNKGGYVYLPDKEAMQDAGRKNPNGIGER